MSRRGSGDAAHLQGGPSHREDVAFAGRETAPPPRPPPALAVIAPPPAAVRRTRIRARQRPTRRWLDQEVCRVHRIVPDLVAPWRRTDFDWTVNVDHDAGIWTSNGSQMEPENGGGARPRTGAEARPVKQRVGAHFVRRIEKRRAAPGALYRVAVEHFGYAGSHDSVYLDIVSVCQRAIDGEAHRGTVSHLAWSASSLQWICGKPRSRARGNRRG